MRVRGPLAGAVCALLFVLAAAPAAHAFSIDNPSVATDSSQAGANTDVTIAFEVGEPEADLRDLTIHLPPGLVGNPLAAPQCTEQQLMARACPPASDVGDVVNRVSIAGAVPQTVSGNLYNMVPGEGEPARFGILLSALPVSIPVVGDLLLPPIIAQSPAALRPDDLGLDSVLENLPRTATLLQLEPLPPLTVDIDITGIELTLAGQVGSPPQGFIRLPTSCKEHTVGFSARAYNGATAEAATTFTTSGCQNVPFSPELTAWVRPQGQGQPADFSTTISQTIEEAGLARAEVTLPKGVIGDIVVLSNTCARNAFFAGGCPDDTVVGDAVATSPLQSEGLAGPVNALEPAAPGLPELGLDLRGPLSLKLTGQTALLAEGRVMNTFAGLPDIPIADFTLTFPRERKLILTDDLCKSNEPLFADVRFVAHSGAELTARPQVEVRGCRRGNKPLVTLKLKRAKSKRPRLTLRARVRAKPLRAVKLRLPKALRAAKQRKLRRRSAIQADGDKLKARRLKRSKRAVTVRVGSAELVRLRLRKGALKRVGKLGRHPRFTVTFTDTEGSKTRLQVRAK